MTLAGVRPAPILGVPMFPDANGSSILNSSDVELAARLAAGDTAALAELVRRFWAPLIRYAVRLVDDPEAAKDISQEVFVRLWNTRTKLRSASIRSYLYRVAHNVAVDELRKRQVRSREIAPDGARFHAPVSAEPGDLLEQRELRDAIARAIRALPPRRRMVLILAYFHGLSYQEIADQVGISMATVKNHLAAALTDLRRTLRPSLANLAALMD